jgi:D-alanyl-D-alanine carboxypeptidase
MTVRAGFGDRKAVIRGLVCLGTVLVVAAGCGGAAQPPRSDLQRVLDGLVAGPQRIAPGATAYVAGPHASWLGSAGWADVTRKVPMAGDARMRLESVSKLWTATVVLALVERGRLRLDDTVERWLPGVFPDGNRITIRELLNHTSGLIDNNDLTSSFDFWLAAIHDPALRARLVRVARDEARDPAAQHSPMLEIEAAAALPLQTEPGTYYHYSNIGYELAGVIAERAAGAPLSELYGRFIIRPLGLKSAAYAPGGRIAGPHPVGYRVQRGGKAVAATAWGTGGLAAQGGIVSNARDEARFLVALMRGRLLPSRLLRALKTPTEASAGYGLGTGVTSACADQSTVYTHNGGGVAWSSSVAVSGDGSHVAVLLLNGRTADERGDARYSAALAKLYCAA